MNIQIFLTKLKKKILLLLSNSHLFGRVFSLVYISLKNMDIWLSELFTCWLMRERRLSSMFSTRIFPPCARSSTPPDLPSKIWDIMFTYINMMLHTYKIKRLLTSLISMNISLVDFFNNINISNIYG